MPDDAITLQQPLIPRRGLVPLHNRRGRPLAKLDVQRWLRLNRLHFKMEKVDLLAHGAHVERLAALLQDAASAAEDPPLALSLRTDAAAAPPEVEDLLRWRLHDLLLTPPSPEHPLLEDWLVAAHRAGLPIRLQLPLAALRGSPVAFLESFAEKGGYLLNLALFDSFLQYKKAADAAESEAVLARVPEWLAAAAAAGVECNVVGLPFCLVPEKYWSAVRDRRQFFLDPQCYAQRPYELAARLYPRNTAIMARVVVLQLGQSSSYENLLDRHLLMWAVSNRPLAYYGVLLARKLKRLAPFLERRPAELPNTPEAFENAIAIQRRQERPANPECARCSLAAICDQANPALRRMLPAARVKAQGGEAVRAPWRHARHQIKRLDALDAARLETAAALEPLAEAARHIVANVPATETITSEAYEVLNSFFFQLPGAVRWFSLTRDEKISTPLATVRPPFTLSFMVGGGIADYAGFSVRRHARILCPMESFNHRIVLHVDSKGQYVLLRDGVQMRPAELEGPYYTPTRIPSLLAPRLSFWDIDGSLFTQNVLLWREEAQREAAPRQKPRFSVVIVSMRFTRRLQAVLRSLAHQRGTAPGEIEVIVAHVPGMDATEDLITSMEMVHPHLQFVRSPFPPRRANAKGYVINESVGMARGEWIVLLDSDTVLPPDFFTRLREAPADAPWAAPDRRKMLSPQTTAAMLVEELRPWEDWERLLASQGEMRVLEAKLPVGFCQCVRAHCFEKVRYPEYEHFEGADWEFIVEVQKAYGDGHWFEDYAVLHLDHGGSQWYGAQRHL